MFSQSDDLFAGVDLPGGADTPWQPGEGDLPVAQTPGTLLANASTEARAALLVEFPGLATKDGLAKFQSDMRQVFLILETLTAIEASLLRRQKLTSMKADMLHTVGQSAAQNAGLVPKEDRNVGGGFSLNIIMPAATPGQAPPAPLVTVVDTSPTALPGS